MIAIGNSKWCSTCCIQKPISEFHRDTKGLYGRSARCAECFNKYKREYYHNCKEKMAESKRLYRRRSREKMLAIGENKCCSKCRIWKHVDDFYRDRNRPDGLYNYCKECWTAYTKSREAYGRTGSAERVRLWREKNPEKWRETKRRYRKRDPEKERIRHAEQRIRRAERYRLMKEKLAELGYSVHNL